MKKTIMALVLALVCSTGIVKAEELTVADDTYENNSIPFDGYNCDAFVRTQIIYPASNLTALDGKKITALKFYLKSALTKDWGVNVVISLKEAPADQFTSAAWVDVTDAVEVFEGVISAKGVTELVITFATPYSYNGGDLLFDLQSTNTGTWEKPTFYGVSDMINWYYHSLTGYSSSVSSISASKSLFTPKTTFVYTEGGSATCDKPKEVLVSGEVEARKVQLNWNKADGVGEVQYALVEGTGAPADDAWSDPTTDASKEYDNLKPETSYKFYVRSYCDAENQSGAISVAFTTPKSCFEPKDLTISNIGANTANLGWSNGKEESGYQYVCVKEGETPDWSKATDDNSMFVELTGLQPVTNYVAYVRSVCGVDDFSEAASVTFKTECGAITALPWSEDFNSVSNLPDCWNRLPSGTYPNVNTYDKALFFNVAAGSNQLAVLPAFASDMTLLTIELDYKTSAYGSTYNATLEIGYLTDAEDAGTFVALSEVFGQESSYTHVKVDLNGAATEANRIALRVASSEGGFAEVDDIAVSLTPGCANPVDLDVLSVTYDGGRFGWKQGDTEDTYQYQVVAKDAAVEDANWTTTTEYEVSVDGLTQDVEYEFVLRSVCDGSKYGDEQRVAFTPVCEAPKNLKVTNITDESAVVSWDDAEGTAWTVKYVQEGKDPLYFVQYKEDGTTVTLSYLAPDAEYSVQVARYQPCESAFTTAVVFHTLCGAQDLPFAEDFEGGNLPDCWRAFDVDGTYAGVQTGGAHGGDYVFKFYGNTTQLLVLPAINEAMKDLTVSLFHKSSWESTLTVGYLEALGTEFHALQALDLLNDYSEEAVAVDLKDAPAAAKYIAIQYSDASSAYNYGFVDDVVVTKTSGTPSSVANTEAKKAAVKIIEDGQMIIIRDGVRYNAFGTKVE